MKLSASEIVDAPRCTVFAALADIDALAAGLRKSGGDLRRKDADPELAAGAAWDGSVVFRGLVRRFEAEITEFDPPGGYRLAGRGEGLHAVVDVALAEMATMRTQLGVDCTIAPSGLGGRVMLQPLKLMHDGLEQRLGNWLACLARRIEAQAAKT